MIAIQKEDDVGAATLWSVVVPTFHRPALLREALSSCLVLLVPENSDFEIVVVDNSQDGGASSVCERFSDPRIRFIHEPRTGLAFARNAGIEAARGDYLVFLDDDERVLPDWLLELHEAFENCTSDVVFGSVEPLFEDPAVENNQYIAKFYRRHLSRAPYSDVSDLLNNVGTGNSAYKRQICFASGVRVDHRFNLSGGEDIELFRTLKAAGRTFSWAPGARVREWVSTDRSSWSYLRTRRRAQGENRVYGLWREKKLSSPPKILLFMAGGALQALVHMFLSIVERLRGRPKRANEHAVEVQGGLGKLFWTAAVRQQHYGG